MENYNQTVSTGLLAGFGIAYFVFLLLVHLFYGYCLKMIAEKTGNGDQAGIWWVPFFNLLIPIRIAGKPSWWIILFLIPIVNIVVAIIVMMAVAEARKKESWWGIIAVLFSIVGIPYLAFSE
ncbi:MAG: signal peptidase I [Bacteroidetes bacterium]|nr:signal peptidase I [Bacteroidota bacterium]